MDLGSRGLPTTTTEEPLLLLLMPPSLNCLLGLGRMTCDCRRGDPDDLMLVAWNASKTTRERQKRQRPRFAHESICPQGDDDGETKTDTTFRETDADACSTVAATAEPARIRTGHALHCALCLYCTSVRHQSIEAQRPGSLGCLGAWAWTWTWAVVRCHTRVVRRRRVSAQISRSRCRAVALVFCFSCSCCCSC